MAMSGAERSRRYRQRKKQEKAQASAEAPQQGHTSQAVEALATAYAFSEDDPRHALMQLAIGYARVMDTNPSNAVIGRELRMILQWVAEEPDGTPSQLDAIRLARAQKTVVRVLGES